LSKLKTFVVVRDGDIYAALCDCHIALGLDPHHTKAHFRKARCLYELRWCQEALSCLNQFKEKFPEQADGTAARTLERDIKAAAFAETEGRETKDCRIHYQG
jgi:WD and tetratricopeptide repeat-containing protein 1